MTTQADPHTVDAPAKPEGYGEFPTIDDNTRLLGYEHYEKLFLGNHFDAFNTKIESPLYGKEYAKMRYIVANFAGLISKVVADLLFIEPPKIKVKDGDQEWVDALVEANKLRIQNYESGLTNSYMGDAVYKIRAGKRYTTDAKSTVIIETVTPKIYFPKIDPSNVKKDPEEQTLAWRVKIGDKEYVQKEIHKPQIIINEAYLLEGTKMVAKVPVTVVSPNTPDAYETKIDLPTLVHVPNWRAGNRFFGISDYFDVETLFYAINNRMSKTDNILDKHSDPILSIPDGILDEKGQVERAKLNLFERPEGGSADNDPAYITWDANLDSAFKEVEKLVEMTFMMTETSPDILGMGQGKSDSGRALKLKLLRTLAKAQRKQLYYTEGLKQVIYTAQVLAKEWGLEINGKKLSGEPVMPEIIWSDGLPADMTEMIEQEAARMDAGLTTVADSIQRLDDIDEKIAEEKAAEIKKATELAMPKVNFDPNKVGQPTKPNVAK